MTLLPKSACRILAVGIALSALCAGSASAETDSIVQKLNARSLNYEIQDENYVHVKLKLQNGRSQTVVIYEITQQIMGQNIRLLLSPVEQIPEGQGKTRIPLDPEAEDLLKNNNDMLMGSWLVAGGNRYFQVKIIDTVDAATLHRLMLNIGNYVDKKEIEISGERDQF